MFKQDQESRMANAMWCTEQQAVYKKIREREAKKERAKVRVVKNEQGNPIDIEM